MANVDSPINTLPRIAKPMVAALKKLGIETVADLLLYFPYRYLDFSKTSSIRELVADQPTTIHATVKTIQIRFSFKSHLSMAEAIVSDETGSMKVVWFNQPYIAKALQKGDEVYLAGKPDYYNHSLQLTNPLYEKVSDFPRHTARLVPLYHLSQQVYPKTFRNLVASVLPLAANLNDPLPQEILLRQGLLSIGQTVQAAHFPESFEQLAAARKRLAFEEIFLNQLLAQKRKMELERRKAVTIPFRQEVVKGLLAQLPFELTPGQKRAAWEILQDMEKPIPMARLIEGDVGSGKTLVALIAVAEAVLQQQQAALMAPTEILARQHYETAKRYLAPLHVRCCLLTGTQSELDGEKLPKPKLQALLKEGMPALVIGTHALISKKTSFKNLAMAVIDEQHRFGVDQRMELLEGKGKVPHLISLTATPIPRTLQLAFYGELQISQIKTKPKDRKPIITKLVTAEDRQKAYDFIAKQVAAGRQVFVVTPLIEESEQLDVKAATTEQERLQKMFPQFTVGLLHGRMTAKHKEQSMADFLANTTQILVSTSVVEVGVDVPNASVMIIEGAERFGLAQLHQFRGRVGRGQHQSYCFVFTESSDTEALSRLQQFSNTTDGFALAELDLKLRGFGELYGSLQSGWNFKYFNPSYVHLIEPARQEARGLLESDFLLAQHSELAKKLKGKTVHFE